MVERLRGTVVGCRGGKHGAQPARDLAGQLLAALQRQLRGHVFVHQVVLDHAQRLLGDGRLLVAQEHADEVGAAGVERPVKRRVALLVFCIRVASVLQQVRQAHGCVLLPVDGPHDGRVACFVAPVDLDTWARQQPLHQAQVALGARGVQRLAPVAVPASRVAACLHENLGAVQMPLKRALVQRGCLVLVENVGVGSVAQELEQALAAAERSGAVHKCGADLTVVVGLPRGVDLEDGRGGGRLVAHSFPPGPVPAPRPGDD